MILPYSLHMVFGQAFAVLMYCLYIYIDSIMRKFYVYFSFRIKQRLFMENHLIIGFINMRLFFLLQIFLRYGNNSDCSVSLLPVRFLCRSWIFDFLMSYTFWWIINIGYKFLLWFRFLI